MSGKGKPSNLPMISAIVAIFMITMVALSATAQNSNSNIVSGSGSISSTLIRCVTEVISDCGDGVVDFNGDGIDDTRIVTLVRETELDECAAPDATEVTIPATPFLQYTGLISNAKENGFQVTRTRAEACARPTQPTQVRFSVDQFLEDATVAGLTGDLEITIHGTGKGDVVPCNPTARSKTRGQLSIQGVSGDLAGATGHGSFNGESWSEPDPNNPGKCISRSFNNYSADIQLP